MQTSDDTVINREESYCGIDEEPRNSIPLIDNLDNNTKSNKEIGINKELEEVASTPTSSRNLNSFNISNPLNDAPFDSKNYVGDNEIQSITLNSSNDTVHNKSIQSSESPRKINIEDDFRQSMSGRFFEEFIHPYSDEAGIEAEDLGLDINHETRVKSDTVVKNNGTVNIDLTQSSDNSLVLANVSDEENETPEISFDNNKNGAKDNVSGDNDELIEDIVDKNSIISYNASKSIVYDIIDKNTAATGKCTIESELSLSQTSEVFEISDKELEYSMHKSMLEVDYRNFDYGGISVVDNIPDLPSIRQSRNHEQSTDHSLNQSRNNSFLPFIDIGGVKENISKEKDPKDFSCGIEASTPFKQNFNQVLNIETPTSDEYVIKTDQVTPMLNYESMTTPERNRELDKYGLKPFKRKRGKLYIQVCSLEQRKSYRINRYK